MWKHGVSSFKSLGGFALVLLLTSCSAPKDTALPVDSGTSVVSRSFPGFNGAVKVVTLTDQSASVQWNAASATSGVLYYRIYNVTDVFNPIKLATVAARDNSNNPVTSTTITQLNKFTYYSIRVRAVDSTNSEDTNTVDVPMVTYGGATSFQVVSGTDVTVGFEKPDNVDKLKITCTSSISGANSPITALLDNSVSNDRTDILNMQHTVSGFSAGKPYSCVVNISLQGTFDNNANSINFTPQGTASKLVVTVPQGVTAGDNFNVKVAIQDQYGNNISSGPDATASVTITAHPGHINGTATVNAVGGIASFNVNIHEAGTDTITAVKAQTDLTNHGSVSMTADSSSFTISPAALSVANSYVTISPDPSTNPVVVADSIQTYAMELYAKDIYNNTISNTQFTFASSESTDNTGGGLTVLDGVTNLFKGTVSATKSGTHLLSITTPVSLAGVKLQSGNAPQVTFSAGLPAKLLYAQPSTSTTLTAAPGAGNITFNGLSPIKIQVADAFGNPVPNDANHAVTVNLSFTEMQPTNPDVLLSPPSNPQANTIGTWSATTDLNGIASFTTLGLDKSGTYRLLAKDGSNALGQSQSPFPVVIAATSVGKVVFDTTTVPAAPSPSTMVAGVCTGYTVKLKDANNQDFTVPSGGSQSVNITAKIPDPNNIGQYIAAPASANIKIFRTAAACPSGAASQSIIISGGKSYGSFYIQSKNVQAVQLGADASGGSIPASLNTNVVPATYTLAGGPLSSRAGCSAVPLTIKAWDAQTVPVQSAVLANATIGYTIGNVNVTAYSANDCNAGSALNGSFVIPAGQNHVDIYFKSGTILSNVAFSVASTGTQGTAPNANPINLTGVGNTTLSFYPSNMAITAPANVYAKKGSCYGPISIAAQDASGNNVGGTFAATLNLSSNSVNTSFFADLAGCNGNTPISTISMTAGSASFYLKNSVAEQATVSIADANANASLRMNLATFPANIWPDQVGLQLVGTADCQPVKVFSHYTANNNPVGVPADAVINLSVAAGTNSTLAGFFSDPSCQTQITKATIAAAGSPNSSVTVYFRSPVPGNYTILAQDSVSTNRLGSDASAQSTAIVQQANPGWLGEPMSWINASDSTTFGIEFNSAALPISSDTDGFSSPRALNFGTAANGHRLLHVVDYAQSRVLQYDYTAGQYIGWIGAIQSGESANDKCDGYMPASRLPSSGVDAISNSACSQVGPSTTMQTPNWCRGGLSFNDVQGAGRGAMSNPVAVTNDGTYLYVANEGSHTVTVYNMATGTFVGFLGTVISGTSTPLCTEAVQTDAGCISSDPSAVYYPAPRLCSAGTNLIPKIGSTDYTNQMANYGDGRLYYPESIAWANTASGQFLYVGVRGAILKFNGNNNDPANWGKFVGWIGMIGDTTGIACASGSPVNGSATPSWCTGGKSSNSSSNGGLVNPTGIYVDTTHDLLFVADSGSTPNPRLLAYTLSSGAFVKSVTSLLAPRQLVGVPNASATSDDLYIADGNRMVKMSLSAAPKWIGKSGTNLLATNAWTSSSYAVAGTEPQAFFKASGVEIDPDTTNGGPYLLSAQEGYAGIKKINLSTGAYVGMMRPLVSGTSASGWQVANPNVVLNGFDDLAFNNPSGLAVDSVNNILYVSEAGAGRVKKVDLLSGKVIGALGAPSTLPTGSNPLCASSQLFLISPSWCAGSWPVPNSVWGTPNSPSGFSYNPVLDYHGWGWSAPWYRLNAPGNPPADGALHTPMGLAMDSTYLYVVDAGLWRVNRYKLSDSTYHGWGLSAVYDTFPSSATADSGTSCFSNGSVTNWCHGGIPAQFFLQNPSDIVMATVNGQPAFCVSQKNATWQFTQASGPNTAGTEYQCAYTSTGLQNIEIAQSVGNSAPNSFWVDSNSVAYISDPGGSILKGTPAQLSGGGGTTYRAADIDKDWTTDCWNSGTGPYCPFGGPHGTHTTVPIATFTNATYLYYATVDQIVIRKPINTAITAQNPAQWAGRGCTPTVWRNGWCNYGTGAGAANPYAVTNSVHQGAGLVEFRDIKTIRGDSNFIYISDFGNNRVVRLPAN